MLIHVDLLRVSLSSVSRLLWHKPCLAVACYLLKTALASVSMLFISPSFLRFHSLMAILFALTRGAWVGGDVLFFFFLPSTHLPSILTFVKPILYVAYFNLEAWAVKYSKQ